MTARELATRMIKYLGLTSLDPDDNSNKTGPMMIGLVDGDREDIVTAINGALEEIWQLVPASFRYRRIGTYVREPTSVTVDLTADSTAVVVGGYQSWMDGCSIMLASGDQIDNELVNQTTLLRPWQGQTTIGNPAVIYQDCLTLPVDAEEIVDPVEIPQTYRLVSAGSRQEFYQWDPSQVADNDYGVIWGRLYAMAKQPDQPRAYFADSEYVAATGTVTRLRLAPMPDQRYQIAYGIKVFPPKITVTDLGVDTDPGKTFPMPSGWINSVLFPVALKRFTAHPAFSNANQLMPGEINRMYQMAIDKATGHKKASVESNRIYTTFR